MNKYKEKETFIQFPIQPQDGWIELTKKEMRSI